MNKFFTCALLSGIVAFSSCRKSLYTNKDDGTAPGQNTSKAAPDGFNYKTSKDVSLNLTLLTNQNTALPGVVVSVYLPNSNAPIYKGVTNSAGLLQGTVTVPSSVTSLIIDPAYVGLMRNAQGVISSGNSITATIGGANSFSGDIQAENIATSAPGGGGSTLTTLAVSSAGITFAYPSPYNSSSDANLNTSTYPLKLGRPAYLEPNPDVISSGLLSYVNASLPEGKPLTTTHPDYLKTSATSDINVTATSDVWITYVSEGAGNMNSLAYFTYPTGNPPTDVSNISRATIIFANASGYGSGGGLKSGDKVKLGRFNAGTSIGFVLIQNAWTGSGITVSNTKYYSDYLLNPETNVNSKKHTVTLYDDVHKLFLIGFEDLNRQGTSDDDFNDLVIYASANPVTAISTGGVPEIDKGGDADGDTVPDELDAFPNDASRAYVSYYPSQTGYATIAFEDNWPFKGDYDLNDLVVNYRYTFTSNYKNQVVDVTGEFAPVASGATYRNGFGVQLPVLASEVQSVSGQQNNISNYITFAGNGVEAGQSKAVIIPFDNSEALIKNSDNSSFVNTTNSKSKVLGAAATIKVTFNSPIDAARLLVSSFNPFLISNLRREYEVHLPGYAPTDKVNMKLFGTADDASAPASGKYYISSANWPWALNFTTQFSYPIEGEAINAAYLHFSDWASSGGTNYPDWYSNTSPGFVDLTKIFTK
ncbi:hypothetical protein GCM10027037_13330 [Mucilaginibacter koreensis]